MSALWQPFCIINLTVTLDSRQLNYTKHFLEGAQLSTQKYKSTAGGCLRFTIRNAGKKPNGLDLRGGIDLVKMANQDDFFSTNTLQISPREKKISECCESLDRWSPYALKFLSFEMCHVTQRSSKCTL